MAKKTVKTVKNTNTVKNNPPQDVETPVTTTEKIVKMVTKQPSVNNLDANHQVELLGLAAKFFHDDPNATSIYGAETVSKMNAITACGIVAAFADSAINGEGNFALVMKKSAYPMIAAVAKDMGISIPELKALPAAKDEEGNAVEDSVQVTKDQINVSEETSEALKNERKVEIAGNAGEIELDPVKVAQLMDEAALRSALQYIMITGPKHDKSIKDTLVDAVDFMHNYRIEQARHAENSTDALNAIEDRSMYDWLTDISNFVQPTVIANGIGKGLITLTNIEKSPLSAFLILRESLTEKGKTQPEWDDKSIADATRFFIEFICKNEIAKETTAIETLDTKGKNYKEIKKNHEDVITKYNNVLDYLHNVSFDICEKWNKEDNTVINKAMGRVWKQYYPECDAAERPRYVGLDENIRQRAGVILNLFRTPGNTNAIYSEANIVEVKKLSLEEYEKLQNLKEQAAKEQKKEQAKNA